VVIEPAEVEQAVGEVELELALGVDPAPGGGSIGDLDANGDLSLANSCGHWS